MERKSTPLDEALKRRSESRDQRNTDASERTQEWQDSSTSKSDWYKRTSKGRGDE